MRAKEFLFEKTWEQRIADTNPTAFDDKEISMSKDNDGDMNFEELKSQLLAQITELPANKQSIDFLTQVKDSLKSSGVSSRVTGLINAKVIKDKLEKINDPDLKNRELDDLLARWIISVPGSTDEKRDFMAKLLSDKLVNKEKLFSDGEVNELKDCIVGYGTNISTTGIVDGMAQHITQGVGPGEILMVALSSSITKMATGDLMVRHPIDGEVELKTSNRNPPRFYDRNVKALSDYDQKSQNFIATYAVPLKFKYPKYGLSTVHLIKLFAQIEKTERDQFSSDLKSIIDSTYPKANANIKGAIVTNIANDNDPAARQAIAQASFENYKTQKHFKGILYIDIKRGKTLYFNDWKDIDVAGARATVSTIYLVAAHSSEAPYPQIGIRIK